MGFFSKITGAVSQLTHKAATVDLKVSELQAKRGDSLDVAVTVSATGQLNAKGLYLELVGKETLRYEVRTDSSASEMSHTESGYKTNETFRQRAPLMDGPLVMSPGETREFKTTMVVPPGAQPTYNGVDARHEWTLRALADVSMGGDPDMEITIYVV